MIVDTTGLSIHDLRRRILSHFGSEPGQLPSMRVRFVSFGFKYGAPVDADLLFDVRFLDNPYFVEGLRDHPGTRPEVRAYVLGSLDAREYLERVGSLLEFCLPRYQREGKSYLTIGVGCTGGRHRSVVLATELSNRIHDKTQLPIEVVHRDVQREAKDDSDLLSEGLKGGGF